MLSIIIPHKNRVKQLIRCLSFLVDQKTNYEYEILVVDGDSKKDYPELRKFILNDNVKFFPININTFNAAKYRNYGVKMSKGSLITFIDVDVIVPNNFVEILCRKYLNEKDVVLIHSVYGFRIGINDEISKIFNKVTSRNIEKIIEKIEFSDYRDSAMEFYNTNFDYCPAPWVYGWSCLISISKELLSKSGLFDENFVGWGSEDTDLAYRLWLNNGKFIHETETFGMHIAHENNNEKKDKQNYLNRRYLYSKYKTFETELYVFLTGVSLNNALNIFKNIHLGVLNPIYTSSQLDIINKLIGNKRTLCIGLDSFQEISRLNFTHYLTLNNRAEKVIAKANRYVKYTRRLGLITDYDDDYFELCIIFDSYNLLPDQLYHFIINEMKRISKNVYQIKTRNFVPVIYNNGAKIKNKLDNRLTTIYL